MKDNEQNTEQTILEAAEAEFMEKGYANAKMLSIARRAGVAHSMLHYYYRSKENLFQTILMKKMQLMIPAYNELFGQENLSLEDVLRHLRDARDRFLWSQNPQMPYFMLTEILSSKKNRGMLIATLEQAVSDRLGRVKQMLQAEIEKGNIRPISFEDFMMLLITIDASSLSAISICRDVHGLDTALLTRLQESYREHNMQLILDALRP